jgi:hypothetical protein
MHQKLEECRERLNQINMKVTDWEVRKLSVNQSDNLELFAFDNAIKALKEEHKKEYKHYEVLVSQK